MSLSAAGRTLITVAHANLMDRAVLGAAMLLFVGFAGQGASIEVPGMVRAVPTEVLVVVAATLVGVAPLQGVVPDLDKTFVRRSPVALAKVFTGLVCAFGAAIPVVAAAEGATLPIEIARLGALLTVGVLASVAMGERGWLIAVMVGLASLVIDGATYGQPPIATTLETMGSPTWIAILLGAAAVYWWRGPGD